MSKERTALITGAGKGIGRGIALELAKAGFNIAGLDLVFEPQNRESGLFEVENRVRELGREFLALHGDISAIEHHGRIIGEVLSRFKTIDVLVNNAGTGPEKRTDILETTPESFDRLMAVNARGPFFFTQAVVSAMLEQRKKTHPSGSCIIFIGSISAEVSSLSRAEYCISKAALSQTARLFAHRLAEHGIAVYEIRPGIIKTDMTAPVRQKYDRMIRGGLVPQGRWGLPEDVGRAAAALAAGCFTYATGISIEMSGGMNIRRL